MGAISVAGAERPVVSRKPEDELIRPLVRDLHKVNKTIYWSDLLLSATFGWMAFGVAISGRLPLAGALISLSISVLCLYRSLCFLHELSHQTRRTLPWFEPVFNLLVGFPLLMPSFVYVGLHQNHHRIEYYGTERDPEYLPFSRSWLMTTLFAFESLFIPLILVMRFVVLTPVGLVNGRFQEWLTIHLSSLTMNPKYRRPTTPGFTARVRRDSALIFCLCAAVLTLAIAGVVPWRVLAAWLLVDSLISFINTLRTLGAHAYESDGKPMDREAQVHDSIDTPGAFWTELWAPVGLRYHALHHYFPGIPYHHLPEAYRRIVRCAAIGDHYREMSSQSLPHSLRALIERGREKS